MSTRTGERDEALARAVAACAVETVLEWIGDEATELEAWIALETAMAQARALVMVSLGQVLAGGMGAGIGKPGSAGDAA